MISGCDMFLVHNLWYSSWVNKYCQFVAARPDEPSKRSCTSYWTPWIFPLQVFVVFIGWLGCFQSQIMLPKVHWLHLTAKLKRQTTEVLIRRRCLRQRNIKICMCILSAGVKLCVIWMHLSLTWLFLPISSFDDHCCHVRKLRLSLVAAMELDFQPLGGASSQNQNRVVGLYCMLRISTSYAKVENTWLLL